MATGTYPGDPTPPPVQAVAARPTAYDTAVEAQLRKTRAQVKLVEIVTNSLLLIAGVFGFLLLMAIVDHWLFTLGFWTRLLTLLVLLGGSGWWFAVRILAPYLFLAMGYTLLTMATAATSTIVGIPKASEIIADEWHARAVEDLRFPTSLDTLLYRLLRIVAFMTILVGWLLIGIFLFAIVAVAFEIMK